MQFWSSLNFVMLVKQNLPIEERTAKTIGYLSSIVAPLQKIADETLYTMQHDGRKIYLEKLLNDYFKVATYEANDHENTKTVYIENLAPPGEVFIYQPDEEKPVFLEPTEVFISQENEMLSDYSFTVFIPDTYTFNEPTVRALIDKYRYIGKLYKIETYTL
jgi:hypothetical protein